LWWPHLPYVIISLSHDRHVPRTISKVRCPIMDWLIFVDFSDIIVLPGVHRQTFDEPPSLGSVNPHAPKQGP
jgi:hypothetical protein